MKERIKQIIVNERMVYIFTDNPEKDILEFQEAYKCEESCGTFDDFPCCLGYTEPELMEYTFLGNKYKCIGLWFDNEDVPDFYINF